MVAETGDFFLESVLQLGQTRVSPAGEVFALAGENQPDEHAHHVVQRSFRRIDRPVVGVQEGFAASFESDEVTFERSELAKPLPSRL